MKTNTLHTPNWSKTLAALRQTRHAISIGLLLSAVPLARAVDHRILIEPPPSILNPGDILRTDPGDAMQGGVILRIDPRTGKETVLSQGGHLGFHGRPMGVAVDQNGQLIVANQACLLRIDPNTGRQTMIRDVSGMPGSFWNLALDRNHDIWVAAESAVLRVNPSTGDTLVVSSNGILSNVLSLALSGNEANEILATSVRQVAGIGWVGSIVRVNPVDGRQMVLSDAGYLGYLLGITVQGDDIYVTGLKGHDQNFGIGQVVRVDARTGLQRVVSEGEYLVRPVGVTVDGNGELVVADPYTMNPESSGVFDGAIIRINPETGVQELVSRGSGSWVNPYGVSVVGASTGGQYRTWNDSKQ